MHQQGSAAFATERRHVFKMKQKREATVQDGTTHQRPVDAKANRVCATVQKEQQQLKAVTAGTELVILTHPERLILTHLVL
jgi:hypothetical protein